MKNDLTNIYIWKFGATQERKKVVSCNLRMAYLKIQHQDHHKAKWKVWNGRSGTD